MLSSGEKNLLKVFGHFHCMEGTCLPVQKFIQGISLYLDPAERRLLDKSVQSLTGNNFIAMINNGFILLAKGEEEIYGPYDSERAVMEFLSLFKVFGLLRGEILTLSMWSPIRAQYLSPVHQKKENIGKTLLYGKQEGLWTNCPEGLMLLEKGELRIYEKKNSVSPMPHSA